MESTPHKFHLGSSLLPLQQKMFTIFTEWASAYISLHTTSQWMCPWTTWKGHTTSKAVLVAPILQRPNSCLFHFFFLIWWSWPEHQHLTAAPEPRSALVPWKWPLILLPPPHRLWPSTSSRQPVTLRSAPVATGSHYLYFLLVRLFQPVRPHLCYLAANMLRSWRWHSGTTCFEKIVNLHYFS